MSYVLGIDLGTSAVKVLLVDQKGQVVKESTKEYPLYQDRPGYSEQNPEDWYKQTLEAIKDITRNFEYSDQIEGLSFSGQMHGLVLLDDHNEVLRRAILWNDTRTTEQCHEIERTLTREKLLSITKNVALEGFTLPKILWVQKHEPEIFKKAATFLLPKDYVRFRLTGKLNMDYSDAAGTLVLDVAKKEWSENICNTFNIDKNMCPELVNSHDKVGELLPNAAKELGLKPSTSVFAGGADNACGAIGSGILEDGKTLSSIGTSGVVLSYEKDSDKDFNGKVHYFNHGAENVYYTMGVTLAAGHSLSWFKNVFASEKDMDELVKGVSESSVGAKGLMFTPYLVGERTPHADANIRSSFIGVSSTHQLHDFTRAVIEGITFSLNESIQIFREQGKVINEVVSIGGGAKSSEWLQIQADIFNAKVVKLNSEQGPGMGAAMLAAYGLGWFNSLKECADTFLKVKETYEPIDENVKQYEKLFKIYKDIYHSTKKLNDSLKEFR